MTRLIPKKATIALPIDKVNVPIEVLPPAQSVIDKKLEKHGYTEDFYAKEYKLKAVHKYLLRNATTEDIANALGITLSEVSTLRLELKERLAASLRSEDPLNLVAEGVAFYDELLGESMRLLDKVKSNNILKTNDLVRVLEIALRARQGKDKFLVDTGLLNNNQRNEHVQQDETMDQANNVRALITDIIQQSDLDAE